MFDLTRHWYRGACHPLALLLLPATCLFAFSVAIRRQLYRHGWLRTHHFPVPVIVVGNIAVGGTGKTPLVIALADYLIQQGYRPGIVSRGYRGKCHAEPFRVQEQATAAEVGDEAILLRRNTTCPIMVCADRVAAVTALLQQTDCNIVITDDGLQHYRLGRQLEVVVVDAIRRFGNRYLLPAGPLRESVARLSEANFVVVNGGDSTVELSMQLVPDTIVALNHQQKMPLSQFKQKTVHAVAGIGHPQRFFAMLEKAGFVVIPHVFPDHHVYTAADFCFADTLPIVMTEKDAVKCEQLADQRYWYVPVAAQLDECFFQKLLSQL